jgi:DNA polymerase
MSETMNDSVCRYLRQQAGMGMPDMVLSQSVKIFIASEVAGTINKPALKTVASPSAFKAKSDIKTPVADHVPAAVSRVLPVLPDTSALPANRTYQEKRAVLVDLYKATEKCVNCRLGGSRTKYVFGAGNAGARLLIVGEAPGEQEDMKGIPFIGPAGCLLTKMLEDVNINRDKDAFITNVCKCRPPANRTPDKTECSLCFPILRCQIDIISPEFILLLGRVAAQAVLGKAVEEVPLARLRGNQFDYKGIPVIVTYHPSALLHNPQNTAPAVEDFKKLAEMMKLEKK